MKRNGCYLTKNLEWSNETSRELLAWELETKISSGKPHPLAGSVSGTLTPPSIRLLLITANGSLQMDVSSVPRGLAASEPGIYCWEVGRLPGPREKGRLET